VKFKVGRLMRETLEDHEVDTSQIVVELKTNESAPVESSTSNV
jgi:hypothetical protein